MSSENIKVSVIILTFNHEKYISQAIESVISQNTDFSFEVIIGDDASTDGTAAIVNDYAQKYPEIIKAVRRKENLGPTRNGYECLLIARGKYIASCEGDDYWTDTQKLKKQVDFLEKNPNYSGVAHEVTIVDENGNPLKNQRISWVSRKRKYTLKDFKGIFLPGHPNSIVRRNFFLEPDFDGSIFYKANRMIGDRTIALIWAAKGSFYRLTNNMGCYRQIDNSVTKTIYDNHTHYLFDFEYTIFLEKYAKEELNVKVNFDYHKSELLAGLLLACIVKKFSNKNDNKLLKTLFHTCSNKLYVIIMIPWHAVRKLIRKLFHLI